MVKNKIILLSFVVVLVLLISIVIGTIVTTKDSDAEGIDVNGNDSTYEFESIYGRQLIHIMKNGAVVSGNAQTDTYLMIGDSVSQLSIENLNQNDRKIFIVPEDDMQRPKTVELIYSGNNEICRIESIGSLNVKNLDDDSSLVLSSGVEVQEDLCLTGGNVTAGYLYSYDDTRIIGDIILTVKESKHQVMEYSMFENYVAADDLTIDLSEDGKVEIYGNDEHYVVYTKNLFLGENTSMTSPQNGIIANCNFGEGPYSSDATIFDSNGNDVYYACFESRRLKNM